MSYVPRSMRYLVEHFTGAQRNVSITTPISGSNVNQNGVIRVRLDNDTKHLLDLRSLTMRVQKGVITGQNGDNVFEFPSTYKLISQINYYANGISLGQVKDYHIIKNSLLKCQTSDSFYDSKILNGYLTDVSSRLTGNIAALGATHAEKPMIEDQWLGFPNCSSYYSTSLWGALEIEIVLNGVEALKGKTGASTNGIGFELQNISFAVDKVSMPPVFVDMLSSRLKGNGDVKLPFQHITSVRQINTQSNRLALASKCVDVLHILPLNGNVVDNAYENKSYVYSSDQTSVKDLGDNCQFQIMCGDLVMPPAPERSCFATDYTNFAWNKNALTGYNQLAKGADNKTPNVNAFATDKNIYSFDLTSEGGMGWSDGVLSGVNAYNNDLVWETKGYPTTNFQWLITAFTTSVLTYSNGQVFVDT